MVSVPLVGLACICIALARHYIRRGRRTADWALSRRVGAWLLLLLGFVLMILGVLMWGVVAR